MWSWTDMSRTRQILQNLWQEKPLLLSMSDTSQGYLHSHWCYRCKRRNKKSNFTNITLEGCQIRAMIDTGTEANVILEIQVPDKIRRLTKTHIQLQPYGCKLITPEGEFSAHTYWKDKKRKSTWIVADDDDLPEKSVNLVPCNLAESLGIITFNTPSMEIKGSLTNPMGTKTASTDDAIELTKSVRPPIARIITSISIPRFRKDEGWTHPTARKA